MTLLLYICYRFGSQHTNADGTNKINKEVYDKFISDKSSKTYFCSKDVIIQLRRKDYNFDRSSKVIEIISRYAKEKKESNINNAIVKEEPSDGSNEIRVGPVDDSDIIKLRPCEKKKV